MDHGIPTNVTLFWRVGIEFVVLLGMGSPMIWIYAFLQGDAPPFKRGFFCDDESLKHPLVPETISVGGCAAIWAAIVLVVVPAVEILIFSIYDHYEWDQEMTRRLTADPGSTLARCMVRIPWVVVELYRIIGYCSFGCLATLLITELAKYKVGRLRPYFLTVCDLELTEDLCKDNYNYNKFVTDYECRGDEREVREAMKSFLSGHSSISFYFATFLVLYLQARLSSPRLEGAVKREERIKLRILLRGVKVLRPFFQFGIFALAIYIAITRISDYKHHPGDVATGIALGICNAVLLVLFQIDFMGKPRSFSTGPNRPYGKVLANSDLELVTHIDGNLDENGGHGLRRRLEGPLSPEGDRPTFSPSPGESLPFVASRDGGARRPRTAETRNVRGSVEGHQKK